MKAYRVFTAARVALLLVLPVLFLGAGGVSDEGARLDTWTLATRLVDKCAGIHEGDLVLVTGNPRDMRLLEDVCVHVRELGAFPFLSVSTDRLTLRSFERTPENVLGRPDPFTMHVAECVSAIISIDDRESIDLLSGIPAAKLDAASRAAIPFDETLLKRNVRMVSLGNGLYPTLDRARRFGITLDELTSIFWDGVNIDPARLQSAGDGVRSMLASGRNVHITKPNGTDLTVNIENRPVFISDGMIAEDDAHKGGPACQVWLPAGEVYLSVVPGTANGKLVSEQLIFNGTTVQGLTVTLKNGKVADITGTSGVEAIKQQYAIGGEGKELLSLIDVGTNPAVTVPPGSTMLSWVTAGMVSIGIGNNSWTGGDNKSSFSLVLQIPGTTTTVDNALLIDRGRLTVGVPLAEVPISTVSQQARTHYRAALQLWEHVREIDARPHVEQAIAADQDFAAAYWLKSQIAPSFAEREACIDKAVSLASFASDGERLIIQATRARFDGNSGLQEECLRRVVTLYPEDKRALLALGLTLWAEQKFEESQTVLRRAIAIDPEYAPAYNLLGYVNMSTGNLTEAERLLKKYVTLIPNEPNSHDSYAELLMKRGRYDESIAEYEKAISLDEQFYSSRIGLAYDYAFKGQFGDARRQLASLENNLTDENVRTATINAATAIALHEGKFDRALEAANRGYTLASKNNDVRESFRYQTLLGDITLEENAIDKTKTAYLKSKSAEPARVFEAASHYTEARNAMTQATLPEDTRANFEQQLRAHEVEVAIRGDDIAAAKRVAEEYRVHAIAKRIPAEIEKSHELAGMIAMADNRLQEAVSELNRSNLHDPRNLYRLVEVYEALGDKVMATDLRQRIASFNETGVSYAFVRRLATR